MNRMRSRSLARAGMERGSIFVSTGICDPLIRKSRRGPIRAAYDLAGDVAVIFAPSGTDLEYVALACVREKGPGGTNAILLGADEVGSGCIQSAHGLYFADETALGMTVTQGDPVPGL